jgi:methylene-tetrahydromethanopterin dehydrogenase
VQVVSPEDLAFAKGLKVAADVNAVPPEGIAGVGVMDDAKPLPGVAGAFGIGALAVGNVKYQTQHRLLVRMQQAEKALVLSFPEAFAAAREYVAEQAGAKPST